MPLFITMTSRGSYKVPGTARSDRGDIRRAARHCPELGLDGCRTLYEAFRHGQQLHPLGPCMGFRAVSTTGFATPYIYSTYTECVARVDAFAAGLDELELTKTNDTNPNRMNVLGLYMTNCTEWILAEHASYAIGACTVPLYDTLGTETVQFILGETSCKSVVATRAELQRLCGAKQSNTCPAFTYIVLVDGVTPDAALMAKSANLQVLSFAKVEAVGAHVIASRGHVHRPPSPEDVATFCYTSGTTGDPKGALLTHQNFVSTMAGVQSVIRNLEAQPFDRHLSYLPLAHIFERMAVNKMLHAGASIAFFRGDPALLIEDLQACRPTLLPVAPRVLNKIYDKILAGMAQAGGTKKKLFDAALAAKSQGLKHGRLKHPVYDRLFFNKLKYALGMDQVRCMVSGSAPLSENVMMFFRCMLGIGVVEGYGQTEGCAGATISHPDDIATVGHVGGPIGTCEICLFDVPDMGYYKTDKAHGRVPCEGRGEICIRGPNVFMGYYKDEAKTKEIVDEEGWLHSGDIGMWSLEGNLHIIDRKKNIFKLAQGEYVAPEKIENILTRSTLISQCFVYGDSKESSLVAIIVPDEDPLRQWAVSSDNCGLSFEELCKSNALKDAIMEDVRRLGRESGLQGFEMVKAIFIEAEPFSVEKDLLTPTFKLKRNKVRDAYETVIKDLYAGLHELRSKL